MPVPIAVIMVTISCDESILSKRAFSTFRILPRKGRIAWVRRSRPCFAEPPAESPSTMYSSHFSGSRSWQSASLPGSDAESSAPLRRTVSRALRAAIRARAASATFAITRLALAGLRSQNSVSLRPTRSSTMPFASVLTSLPLRFPSNCAPGILTETTAVNPSRMSSPEGDSLISFQEPFSSPYFPTVRVSVLLKPIRCGPPSTVLMLFAKEKTFSSNPSIHCSATLTSEPSTSPRTEMGGSKSTVLFLFKSSTYATIPPSYLKSWLLSKRSSRIKMRSPGLRNASSRIRLESTSKLKSVASRTDAEPLEWMVSSMVLAWPASASSTELSTTSYTRWCSPSAPTPRMYMCGRLRTASSPSRTLMLSAEYSPGAGTGDGARFSCAVSKISPLGSTRNYHPKGPGSKAKRPLHHSENRTFSGAIRKRRPGASQTIRIATGGEIDELQRSLPARDLGERLLRMRTDLFQDLLAPAPDVRSQPCERLIEARQQIGRRILAQQLVASSQRPQVLAGVR